MGDFFAHDVPSFCCDAGKNLEGAMDEAGKHLEGAMDEAGKHLEGAMDETGKNLEETRKASEEFFTKQFPEFFAQNAKAMEHLLADSALFFKCAWEEVLGPEVRNALQQLAAGVSASLAEIEITAHRTLRFFEHMAKHVGDARVSTFVKIKCDQIPKKVLTWVEQHPWQTAFYVASGVVFILPALAYGPTLGMWGFSAAGPVAGSLAAGIQSSFSPVVAGGVFATLQSAAMGGFGAGTVAALTQAGTAVAATAVGFSNNDSVEEGKDAKEE